MAAALVRLCRRTLAPSSTAFAARLLSSASGPVAPSPSSDRVRWDYRGQRRVIPLGQWVPKIAVDAYVAPNAVLAGQVTVYDGASVWNGAVLRGDLNKITVGFCSNVQERCVLHAAWSSPTGKPIRHIQTFSVREQLFSDMTSKYAASMVSENGDIIVAANQSLEQKILANFTERRELVTGKDPDLSKAGSHKAIESGHPLRQKERAPIT